MKIRQLFLIIAFTAIVWDIQSAVPREMRAAWIATVVNIDWPHQNTLNNPAAQRTDMIAMLDTLKALHFNTVIFQIRPTADAFYYSQIEPWSRYLTGVQGLAPNPLYDPLAFIIEEAHRRSIEIHVWLNPYRVSMDTDITALDSTHLLRHRPDLFAEYGGKYYFNPAKAETRTHLNRVVADIVARYDIDAVHFDDYFYPYPVGGCDFPDQKDFEVDSRGFQDKGDWRRDNINRVIDTLHSTIKAIKPWVDFGISPFGVWRNQSKDIRGSATRAGSANYDVLYADILKWLAEGSIDYVMPQLYWEIGKKAADYAVLAEWWNRNTFGRNLYIGLFASQLGNKSAGKAWNDGNELMRQLALNKQYTNIKGVGYYSIKAIMGNYRGLADSLHTHYRTPALVPPCDRSITDTVIQPQNVHLQKEGRHIYLLWHTPDTTGGARIANYVVYAARGYNPDNVTDSAHVVTITADNCIDLRALLPRLHGKYTLAITAVNRYRHESLPVITRKRF